MYIYTYIFKIKISHLTENIPSSCQRPYSKKYNIKHQKYFFFLMISVVQETPRTLKAIPIVTNFP